MKLLDCGGKKYLSRSHFFFRFIPLLWEKQIDKETQQPGEVINLLMKVLLEPIAEKLNLNCD